jgi:hypothetical protein
MPSVADVLRAAVLGVILRLAFTLGSHRVAQSVLFRRIGICWHVALLFSAPQQLEGCVAPLDLNLFFHILAVFRQQFQVAAGSLRPSSLSANFWPRASEEFSLPFGYNLSLPLTPGTLVLPLLFLPTFLVYFVAVSKRFFQDSCTCLSATSCLWLSAVNFWGILIPMSLNKKMSTISFSWTLRMERLINIGTKKLG